MDYAESRTREVRRIAQAVAPHANKVRILLLARATGDWWDQLRADLQPFCGLVGHNSLTALDSTFQERHAAYNDAINGLVAELTHLPDWRHVPWDKVCTNLPEPDLGNAKFDSILTVQLQALVSLLDASGHFRPHPSSGDLESDLLNHERRYWSRTARREYVGDLDYPADLLGAAVAAAHLTGADSEDEATTVLSRVRGLTAAEAPETVRRSIARWIAGVSPSSAAYWGSLQPDRVGDRHIAQSVGAWPTLLPELLRGANARQLYHASVVLARAMRHQPDLLAHVVGVLVTGGLDAILAHADPYLMLTALKDVRDPSAQAVIDLYRKCAPALAAQHPEERASQLELVARQIGHIGLAERIAAANTGQPLRTRWIDWRPDSTLAVVLDRTPRVRKLAIAHADNRVILVIGGEDGTVQLSQLESDSRPFEAVRHSLPIEFLMVVSISGQPYLVSIDRAAYVHVISLAHPYEIVSSVDLAQHQHNAPWAVRLSAAAIAYVNDRPILVTAMDTDLLVISLDGTPEPSIRVCQG